MVWLASERLRTLVLVAALTGGLAAAPTGAASWSSSSPSSSPPIRSVVVLGDSVAAGEGTLDGYRYQDRAVLPGWSASGTRRAYDGVRPECRRSPRAYGRIVARALGATVTSFACSGASFADGIVLDAAYDRAEPDLVLITAGANSVDFERVFAYCVLASRGLSDGEAARIAGAPTVTDAMSSAIRSAIARATAPSTPAVPATTPACTAANPGEYLQRTVLDRTTVVAGEARALALAIRDRGRDAARVPEIVFTTYFDPLPDHAVAFARCPDGAALGAAQLEYMHGLVRQLNDALVDAVADVPGTRVADPGPAFAGHRWCDADPWVYGTSILVTDASSTAPFHPTPAGQRAIAGAVLDVVRGEERNRERGVSGPI
jgi:lysophospholipase L1-like esterase